jgi:hypothetical protein
LRNQARIVGWRRKRSDLITGVADDERDAFFSPRGARHDEKRERDQRKHHRDHVADAWHDIPHPKRKLKPLNCGGAERHLNRSGQ